MSSPRCEGQLRLLVRLYGEFAKQKGQSLTLTLPEGSSVAEAIRALGLAPREVGPVFVGGKYARLTRLLREGDEMGLFPRSMSLVYVEVTYEAQQGRLAYVPPREEEP